VASLLRNQWRDSPEYATIDSYEKYKSPKYVTDPADRKGVDREYIERLKALGYIR